MNKTELAVSELRGKGLDDRAIMDALCDGKALESMGLGDEDQEDIECIYSNLKAAPSRP
jgi:hypothetical protein